MRLKRILGGLGVIALAAVGTQLVSVQASSAHTPSASVTCTTWSIGANSYEAAQHNTYSYSIDGAAAITGSFGAGFSASGTFAAGSGDHTLVGYVYQNNDKHAQYSRTYSLSTSGCATYLPIPAAPVPTPPTCAASGTATIPSDTTTVHWSLNGNVATATAKGAQKFSGGVNKVTFTETVLPKLDANSDGCATHVTAAAPVFTNGDCDTAPSLTGAIGGTGYTVAVTGSAAFGQHVVVTFTAEPNYRLDGQTVYTFDYAAQPDCRTVVSPVNPAVSDSICDSSTGIDSGVVITPAITDGIGYTLDGDVVTATATDGNKLGDLPDGWTLVQGSDTVATFTVVPAAAPICSIDTTSTEPTFADDVCASGAATGSSITLPSSTGVDYLVDGTVTAAGTHAALDGSSVTVTARAQAGYTLTGVTEWAHTFNSVPVCLEVGGVHTVRPPAAHAPAHQPVSAATAPLASTGVPALSFLLIGGILTLLGSGLCIAATTRRGSRA